MNDGWESPDECSGPAFVKHNSYQRTTTNWRSNRKEFPRQNSSTSVDDTWGDVQDFKPRRFPNRPRVNDGPITTMEVPTNMVGRIIGRGGSKITDLQQQSGTKIVVTKEQSANGTIVKLFGDQLSVENARKMIEELINDKPQSSYRMTEFSDDFKETSFETKINWKQLSEEYDKNNKLKWSKLPKLLKNFYYEDTEIANMSEEQVKDFRLKNNNIVVSRVFTNENETHEKMNKVISKPVQTFEQAFHPWPEILDELYRAGFSSPSPIQAQAWPALLAGEDVIGIAQTGTGKTLAFLLPALVHIEHQPVPRSERNGANLLVLAPTRELALQIEREVAKYHYRGIKAVCLYGGGNRREQVDIVMSGVEIIIATPGRLNDLVSAGYIDVTSVTYLVLDEADRMLDMGFEPQIRKVLLDIRPDRQTVMTSATWPPGVRRLAQSYMKDPLQIYVGSLDLTAVHTVEQQIILIDDDDEEDKKYNYFMSWVQQMDPDDKVIVFCGKKARADHISAELVANGIECQALHGDREQSDREQAVYDITHGAVQVLVATDVASRGLDIQDLTHVFNYDFPRNIEEYVHRVGRTGRAGRSGAAISFVTRGDWAQAEELIRILEDAEQYVPQGLIDMSQRYSAWKEKKNFDRGGNRGRGQYRRHNYY